jgi:hypothetical protein
MTRHAILSTIVLIATLVAVACGSSTPPRPELTDPKAIIAAAAAEAAAAPGVHIDLSVDGSLTVDLLGTGGGGPVDLTGTTASADIAIASGDARVTFAIASAIRGELRSVDGTAYLKTTLTGAQYRVQEGLPVIPPDAIPTALKTFLEILEEPGLVPVKEADVECAGGTCYRVTLTLTVDELAELGVDVPAGLPLDIDGASLDLAIDVTRDTNDLAGLEAVLTQADGEGLSLQATFTKWDDEVVVEAPAADEIAPAE